MKPSDPIHFSELLKSVLISVLMIGLFILCTFSWFSLGRLYLSKTLNFKVIVIIPRKISFTFYRGINEQSKASQKNGKNPPLPGRYYLPLHLYLQKFSKLIKKKTKQKPKPSHRKRWKKDTMYRKANQKS